MPLRQERYRGLGDASNLTTKRQEQCPRPEKNFPGGENTRESSRIFSQGRTSTPSSNGVGDHRPDADLQHNPNAPERAIATQVNTQPLGSARG